MIPALSGGVDHVHVYVPSRRAAADWYEANLGFHTVEAFESWTQPDAGPLTIADASDRIHLALFKTQEPKPVSLAFGATAAEFLAWREHLKSLSMQVREADHELAWSLYFDDPYANQIEITTYQHQAVRGSTAEG